MQESAETTMLLAEPVAAQAAGWQARAIREYERSLPAGRTALRADLATRLQKLTGRHVAPDEIYVDAEKSMALANVDGAVFRLYRRGGLVLVRPCAYCGTGHFESPKITSRADLGHALPNSGWRPLHGGCEDYCSEDLADW